MKAKLLISAVAAALLAGCAHESVIPMGNDMAEINVSGPGVMKRADTQRIAMLDAAKATIKMGYDKFIILNSNAWSESVAYAGSSGNFQANPYYASGSSESYAGTMNLPESKLIIKMFHNGEKGSVKAVDAKQIIEMNK